VIAPDAINGLNQDSSRRITMQYYQKLDVHGLSLKGEEHDANHDHFAIATLNKSMRLHQSNLTIDDESRVHGHSQGHLFLVADGVGGGPQPARASSTAVDSIVRYFLNEMPWYHFADGGPEAIIEALEDALENAQDELFRLSSEHSGLGTTLTLALVFWPDLYIAHVGDSRCYLDRDGMLSLLTTDHTLASVRRRVGGEVTTASERTLWNAVGGSGAELHPEVRHIQLEAGDVLALVTDGVTQGEPARRLEALRRDESAEDVCERIVRDSGADDRTAIVVKFLPHEDDRAELVEGSTPPELAADRRLRKPRLVARVDDKLRRVRRPELPRVPGRPGGPDTKSAGARAL